MRDESCSSDCTYILNLVRAAGSKLGSAYPERSIWGRTPLLRWLPTGLTAYAKLLTSITYYEEAWISVWCSTWHSWHRSDPRVRVGLLEVTVSLENFPRKYLFFIVHSNYAASSNRAQYFRCPEFVDNISSQLFSSYTIRVSNENFDDVMGIWNLKKYYVNSLPSFPESSTAVQFSNFGNVFIS
jgi:hypothetical protein